jgi:hypothetical protein
MEALQYGLTTNKLIKDKRKVFIAEEVFRLNDKKRRKIFRFF